MPQGLAMARWSVTVFNTTPQGCKTLRQKSLEAFRTAIVARWEVGYEGTKWIQALVEQGKARQQDGNWYPLLYLVSAQHVLSVDLWDRVRFHQEEGMVAEFPGDEAKPEGRHWYGFMQVREFHPDRLHVDAPDTVWTIEVWGMD